GLRPRVPATMTPPPPRRDSSPPSGSSDERTGPPQRAGSGRRPSPVVVACALLTLVLLLSLVAYLGVRAWIGGPEGEEQSSALQPQVVVATHWGGGDVV